MSSTSSVSIRAWLKEAWQLYLAHIVIYFKVSLILIAVSWLTVAVIKTPFAPLVSLYNLLVMPVLNIGWQWYLLQIIRKKEPKIQHLLIGFPIYGRLIGVLFMLALRTGFGVILFIVPGLIWAVEYQFAPLIALDKKTDVSQSFTASQEITKGYKWQLFSLFLLQLVAGAIGYPFSHLLVRGDLSAFTVWPVIGYLITIFILSPVLAFARLVAYRELSAR